MSGRERDPSRCRILREADRTLRAEIVKLGVRFAKNGLETQSARERLRELGEKRWDLQRQLAALMTVSAIGRRAGPTLGASLVKIEIRLELVLQEIERVQVGLQRLKDVSRQLQKDLNWRTIQLQQNAESLNALNCVI